MNLNLGRSVLPLLSFAAAAFYPGNLHAAGPLPPAVVVFSAMDAHWDQSGGNQYSGLLYSWNGGGYESSNGTIAIDTSGTSSQYVFQGDTYSQGYWTYTSGWTEYPSPYEENGEMIYPDPIWHPEESYWTDGYWSPFLITGTYHWGAFSSGGINSVTTENESWPGPPPEYAPGNVVFFPPALLVDGVTYGCFPVSPEGPFYYYDASSPDYFVLDGGNVTSSVASGAYTGSYTGNTDGGVFHLVVSGTTDTFDTPDLRPSDQSGEPLTTTTDPAYGPPGISVNGNVWLFQGTVLSKDYYMGAQPGQRLTISSDHNVSLEDRPTGMMGNAGRYDFGLFQGLPEPVRALDASGNPINPKPSGQGPASVVINGTTWYRSGEGGDSYDAYYGSQFNQVLYLYGGSVWLSDAVNGIYTGGTYSNGIFQGLQASVRAGDVEGTSLQITQNRQRTTAVQTILGDLDIYGNLLTLGTWHDNTANPGFSLGFTDANSLGSPYSILSFLATRPQSQWIWAHGTDNDAGARTMMKLDSGNQLILYTPSDNPEPKIILNPGGRSRFDGPIRIKPQGDISMGQFTQEPAGQ